MHIHYARIVVTLYILAAAGSGLAKGVPDYRNKPDKWFAGDEAKSVAANILSWQSDLGGWPKNQDTTAAPYAGAHREVDLKPTFDNGATTDELRFLARMYNATHDAKYQGSIRARRRLHPQGPIPHRRLAAVLPARQAVPPLHHLQRRRDGAADAASCGRLYTSDRLRFVDADRKNSAQAAFDRGIECILKCQIKVDGKPTAWCAQHDEKDYSPRIGRSFELAVAERGGVGRDRAAADEPRSPEPGGHPARSRRGGLVRVRQAHRHQSGDAGATRMARRGRTRWS